MSVYVDTSALAKWYINEERSEEVEAFLLENCPVNISLLTKVEMHSLMARRVREHHMEPVTQAKILACFEGDIAAGHLVLIPQTVESFLLAESLVGARPDVPLTTLDALHLAAARANEITTLATADRVLARAADALNVECRTFF
jgi:uncharacterized protein